MSRVSLEAGLPNVKGYFSTVSNNRTGGAGYQEKNYSGDYFDYHDGGGWGYERDMGIDASKSNSIYGASTTVTPLSLSCIQIIKY